MALPRLILASASPRRKELLSEAGYEFVVHPSKVHEESHAQQGLLPAELALELAEAKARAVAAQFPRDIVLAADTVVAFGDEVLGNPADAEHAKRMLQLLSGTTHIVITGLAVLQRERNWARSASVISAVRMRQLSKLEIDNYVACGQWEGKAGGYGIQDPDPFVVRITGSHSNIVGLPMKVTSQLLAEAGVHPIHPSQLSLD